ncbi:MAG: hypothetical protein ACP6IU_11080 [Candidatus Asgardarchaeia archaeon]
MSSWDRIIALIQQLQNCSNRCSFGEFLTLACTSMLLDIGNAELTSFGLSNLITLIETALLIVIMYFLVQYMAYS